MSHDFQQNYFEIFKLSLGFDVDLEDLSNRSHELLLTVHPDKFVSATDQEKRMAVQWTTQVNVAFDTLKTPLLRAIYLLKLAGIELEANPTLKPLFLMQQVELREDLEEIEEEGEAALSKLDDFKRKLRSDMKGVETKFGLVYEKLNEVLQTSETYTDEQKLEASELVYELQFTNKLIVAANQVEEKLLDY